MPIPQHQQWMQSTSLGVLRPRSTALKALDDAILQYQRMRTDQTLWAVRRAFDDWKRSKGAMWKQSERNRTGAITQLEMELSRLASASSYQASVMTPQELQALAFVRQQRTQVIKTVFQDKTVTLKAASLKDRLVKAREEVKSTSEKAVATIRAGGSPPSAGPSVSDRIKGKLTDAAKDYFGVAGLEALGSLSGLVFDVIERTAVQVAPVVGHIKDGYDLFTGWAKVGSLYVKQHSIAEREYVIDTGIPSVAFNALVVCLKAETRNEVASATNATASFALKTGLSAVDGGTISGPVVGAASALATLMQTLALLAIEWRATKRVNEALDNDELDIRLFRTYPLMGCYLLTSATLSDLIPIESFATPGWMDHIEKMKQHQFDEVYGAATELIDNSPWEIIGLPKRPKGTSMSLMGEAGRIWSAASPLKDLHS